MAKYVIIDTNVVVSAMLSVHDDSATVQTLRLALKGDIIPLLSKDILKEYDDVLHRAKFSFKEEDIKNIISTLEYKGIMLAPDTSNEIIPDMKDLPFYELYLDKEYEESYLITGNIEHFPKKPNIITPRQLIDVLEKHIEVPNERTL